MTKLKMCTICNRLLNLNEIECPCGGKEFKEVLVDYTEEKKEDIKKQCDEEKI